MQANRAEVSRGRTAVALFQHYSADYESRRSADPHSTETPLGETVLETQPVTGQSAKRIRTEVEQVLILDQEVPWLADLVDSGCIDLGRTRPVTDALKDDLVDHPEARARGSKRWPVAAVSPPCPAVTAWRRSRSRPTRCPSPWQIGT